MADYEVTSSGGSGNSNTIGSGRVGSEGPSRIQALITTAVATTVLTTVLWALVPFVWDYLVLIVSAVLIALGYGAVVVYRRMGRSTR